MNKEDLKDVKKDIKRETKSILNMLLSSSKAVFFKFILGKYIKAISKKNDLDLETLSKLDPKGDEFKKLCQEVLDCVNKQLAVEVEDELLYILKAKQDYRLRNNK